jgi:hypothetical protein
LIKKPAIKQASNVSNENSHATQIMTAALGSMSKGKEPFNGPNANEKAPDIAVRSQQPLKEALNLPNVDMSISQAHGSITANVDMLKTQSLDVIAAVALKQPASSISKELMPQNKYIEPLKDNSTIIQTPDPVVAPNELIMLLPDPSMNDNVAIKDACQYGKLAVVRTLLRDSNEN